MQPPAARDPAGLITWRHLYVVLASISRGDNLDQIKASRGLPGRKQRLLYLILAIVGLGIISYALMQQQS